MIALVVGCAKGVWREVYEARLLTDIHAVYCVKKAGVYWPDEFDYWVTLHPEYMPDYKRERQGFKLPNGYQVVAPPVEELSRDHRGYGVDRRVSHLWTTGVSSGSGLYAAKVAMEDGYKVILAGCPMDDTPYFYHHKRWKTGGWTQFRDFEKGFSESRIGFGDRVRSMSGRTKELLGFPDFDWLDRK